MSVHDDLCRIGTHVGSFNQGDFSPWSAVEGQDLTGGYCAGVVLDWVRRVLQSAPNRTPGYLTYSSSKLDTGAQGRETRRQTAVRRMAVAYGGQGASYVETTNLAKLRVALPALIQQPEVRWEGGRFGVGVPSEVVRLIEYLWVVDFPVDHTKVFAAILTHDELRNWLRQAVERSDPQMEPRAAAGREWASFAAQLDARFRQIRIHEGRQESTRPFGNLRIVASSPSQVYGEGGLWLGELKANGFRRGCATIVSMGPSGGGTGHAVAVHQVGDDQFIFLDPNFGVYRMSKAGIGHCFQHLFWTPYVTAAPNTLDGAYAVYRRRDPPPNGQVAQGQPSGPWNRMAFTIFGT